jgi:[ribosomal protein S5]-alanine N-acetyltransferase
MTIFQVAGLSIRELDDSDASDMFLLMDKELVKRYIPDRFSRLEEMRDTLLWLIGNYRKAFPARLTYKVCLGDKLIGWVSYGELPSDEAKKEVAYVIDPEYWDRGYATLVLGGFLDWLRGTGRTGELFAEIDVENPGSRKVAERNGFKEVGDFLDAASGKPKKLYRLG